MEEREKIKSFKDLEIWKKGVTLAADIYAISKDFRASEIYGLTNQMRRASYSISANVAEGYGRESTKNYLQFIRTARGSLYELETYLIVANKLNYLDELKLKSILQKTEELSKMINSLIRKLNQSI